MGANATSCMGGGTQLLGAGVNLTVVSSPLADAGVGGSRSAGAVAGASSFAGGVARQGNALAVIPSSSLAVICE